MRDIIVSGEKCHFEPKGIQWLTQNKESEFWLGKIGRHEIFIKRQRSKFSGWMLVCELVAFSAKKENPIPHTPKVLSINYDGKYYYYVTEKISGNECPSQTATDIGPVNVRRIVGALRKINEMGYWYRDLCTKNIIIRASDGRAFLIDIDSCYGHDTRFSFGLDVSNTYTLIIQKVSEKYMGGKFKVNGMHGQALNMFEAICFAIHASVRFRIHHTKVLDVLAGLVYKNYKPLCESIVSGDFGSDSKDWDRIDSTIEEVIKTAWQ